jgi:YD repeat-containing protein
MALEHYDSFFRTYPDKLAEKTAQCVDDARTAFAVAARHEAARAERLLAERVVQTSVEIARKVAEEQLSTASDYVCAGGHGGVRRALRSRRLQRGLRRQALGWGRPKCFGSLARSRDHALPSGRVDGFCTARAGHGGAAFVLVRETSSLRAAQGQTVTLVRDAQGQIVARTDRSRGIGC